MQNIPGEVRNHALNHVRGWDTSAVVSKPNGSHSGSVSRSARSTVPGAVLPEVRGGPVCRG